MQTSSKSNAGAAGALKTLQILVYPDKCIGAGHCVACASDVFSQNEDDGVVILLEASPSPERVDAVESAARMCPTSAIEINKNW